MAVFHRQVIIQLHHWLRFDADYKYPRPRKTLDETVDGRNFASTNCKSLSPRAMAPPGYPYYVGHPPPPPKVQCWVRNGSLDLQNFFRSKAPQISTLTALCLNAELRGTGGGCGNWRAQWACATCKISSVNSQEKSSISLSKSQAADR